LKKPSQKWTGGIVHGVGPEFKPQYQKKKKKREREREKEGNLKMVNES
jgi:hypothetical protein